MKMQILVSSDDQACCDEELVQRIEGVMEGTLERFGDRVSRVEVRLSELNSPNPGDRDKSCTLEAKVAGLAPVVASHEAPTLTEAIHGAADKLKRSVASGLRQESKERVFDGPQGSGEAHGPVR
jgi:hypothetical protein